MVKLREKLENGGRCLPSLYNAWEVLSAAFLPRRQAGQIG
jgi:hypothetical protein